MQHAQRALTLQQRVLCDWHTVSHAKVEKVCWYQGDFVEEINFAKGVPMIYVNFTVTVIIIAVKKQALLLYRPLCLCVYLNS
jgi:hypothetical protein